MNKTCYSEATKNYTCIQEECKNLTGIFNCTRGTCHNITDAFECEFVNLDPITKCSGRRGKVTCMEIHGLYTCSKGACERIRAPYNCDRRCRDIPTRNKNVILLHGDNVSKSLNELTFFMLTKIISPRFIYQNVSMLKMLLQRMKFGMILRITC